jgi:hypothetical protein
MLCVTGSWDEVIDWMEKYILAGARTVVLRFAARDQLAYLEACAEALSKRGLLNGSLNLFRQEMGEDETRAKGQGRKKLKL